MDNKLQVRGRDDLLALLRDEQDKARHISEQFIEQTAQSMGLSISEVYGIATFYHFLSTRPLGRNVIRVCKSIPCYLKSSQLIVETVQAELGIAPGKTSLDGRFSLQLTNCIGACDQAPAMLLNHDLHGNLTPVKIAQILEACP
ncbi:MAG: NAD(P)H-dependent oxidoreductase subunit E [Anaerolineales bacterium]|nr:NAD(P)H-dependent oxidoreductase subunit E [Anaerolineales bacterium]